MDMESSGDHHFIMEQIMVSSGFDHDHFLTLRFLIMEI